MFTIFIFNYIYLCIYVTFYFQWFIYVWMGAVFIDWLYYITLKMFINCTYCILWEELLGACPVLAVHSGGVALRLIGSYWVPAVYKRWWAHAAASNRRRFTRGTALWSPAAFVWEINGNPRSHLEPRARTSLN